MLHKSYVVFQFQKDGIDGVGATDQVVFANDPPTGHDVAMVSHLLCTQHGYDQVIILHWHALADEFDEADMPTAETAATEVSEETPAEDEDETP